jgi:HEPN domain-containing protein
MNEKLPDWQIWLNYADEDLKSAEVLLNSKNVFPRNVCYLCQQAVEKSLKAIYIFLNLSFHKTHDLDFLRENLPLDWKLNLSLSHLSDLTEWAVEARYPGDYLSPSEQDAIDSINCAKINIQTITLEIYRHLSK